MGAIEKVVKHTKEEKSDNKPSRCSISSQVDTPNNDADKIKRTLRVPKKLAKREPADIRPRTSQGSANHQEHGRLQFKASITNQKRSQMLRSDRESPKNPNNKNLQNIYFASKPSSELSEEAGNRTVQEVKEIDVLDEVSFCDQNRTDDEIFHSEENTLDDDRGSVYQKIEEMESRIEKLEEELREVAALEFSLYSVLPEHGSSAHKVYTPARRLARLYLHACKYWNGGKMAKVAKSTISGLVLIAKSCTNDVSRLTFWLSNTVVLRRTVSQTLGNSISAANLRTVESNGGARKPNGKHTSVKLKSNSGYKEGKQLDFAHLMDDWQDIRTFNGALEKIESWIFSRIVESVWWQTLVPHMQSVVEDLETPKSSEKMLGPALGHRQHGNFSVNLWKSAFYDAFSGLCPVRAGGQQCGCLAILAIEVMKQCISRLDVAMFNAILRESDDEIPADPLSDPIIDPKVLPIPTGHLSFGFGAQLKSAIGNLSRWLTDLLGLDADNSSKDGQDTEVCIDRDEVNAESEHFPLLNELSGLLMLPKDMLLDRTIRQEVCPSIGMPIVMRILCDFTPDEFCPDPVPGIVLEQLHIHTESILERRVSSEEELVCRVPYAAAPVVYSPPLPTYVAEELGDMNGEMHRMKGYNSEDDLDELDEPLLSIMDTTLPMRGSYGERSTGNSRYKLLRQVWCL